MRKKLAGCSGVSALVLVVQLVSAQITPPPDAPDVGPMITLTAPPAEPLNRIGINYRLGLNISADFKKLGGRFPEPVPLSGSAVNRNYDTGYNRIDIDNNNHGGYIGTWYWGNYSPSSVQNNNLVLQDYASPANATSRDRSDDPHHGFEITYGRELYRRQGWRAGVEGAFGYTRISISDHRSLRNVAYRTNDFFALNGVSLSSKAYTNTFDGPDQPVIGSEPGPRTVDRLASGASITGARQLDANVFLFRFGPYLEIPISEKFSAILSGGLTLGFGDTHFKFRETVSITDPLFAGELGQPLGATVSRSGSGSQTDFLLGGYVGASLSYALTERVSLLVGAQFQAAGEAVNNTKGKQAILDLGQSIIVSLGANYSF